MPCRVNRRRLWAHRITLEALQHADNSFVTLTYDDDHVPPELKPDHVQDWLKRFRFAIRPDKVRYFLVGEYGDLSWRPHYHLGLFGYPACTHVLDEKHSCPWCITIRKTWGKGHIVNAQLTPGSANYIAGYVTKKMTNADDPRLNGRSPEFTRMSLRPGIGLSAMHEVASQLLKYDLHERAEDVPAALRHGQKLLPLGRYLRRSLREMVGKSPSAPQATLDELQEKMQHVFEAAKAAAPIGGEVRRIVTSEMLAAESNQAVRNMESRSRLFKRKRPL